MGYVHHRHYFVYFELARSDMARATGVPYTVYEAEGAGMPLLSCGAAYRRPARYDDLLAIGARVAQLTPVRIRIDYVVHRLADRVATLLASGYTEHVFANAAGRPVRVNRIPIVWDSLNRLAAHPVFPDLVAHGLVDRIDGI